MDVGKSAGTRGDGLILVLFLVLLSSMLLEVDGLG